MSSNPYAPNHDRSAGTSQQTDNRLWERCVQDRENAVLRSIGYDNDDLRALGRL
jgi:hypothetical protein